VHNYAAKLAEPSDWNTAQHGPTYDTVMAWIDVIDMDIEARGDLLEAFLCGAKTPEVKNALESGTDTAGGYTIPTEIMRQFIDKLRAQTVFIQAGARTMAASFHTRSMRPPNH
jgi:HK97 family phage major capsid protein